MKYHFKIYKDRVGCSTQGDESVTEIAPGNSKVSHIKLQKVGYPTVTIPDHDELKKGTIRHLRKMLDIAKRGQNR